MLLWTKSPAAGAAAGSPRPPPGSQTPCCMAQSPGDHHTLLCKTHLDLYLREPGEGRNHEKSDLQRWDFKRLALCTLSSSYQGWFQWKQAGLRLDLCFAGTYFNDLSFRERQLFLSSIRIGWHGGRFVREEGHKDADITVSKLWGIDTTCRRTNTPDLNIRTVSVFIRFAAVTELTACVLRSKTNVFRFIKYLNRSAKKVIFNGYTPRLRVTITRIDFSNVDLMTTVSEGHSQLPPLPHQEQRCYEQQRHVLKRGNQAKPLILSCVSHLKTVHSFMICSKQARVCPTFTPKSAYEQ